MSGKSYVHLFKEPCFTKFKVYSTLPSFNDLFFLTIPAVFPPHRFFFFVALTSHIDTCSFSLLILLSLTSSLPIPRSQLDYLISMVDIFDLSPEANPSVSINIRISTSDSIGLSAEGKPDGSMDDFLNIRGSDDELFGHASPKDRAFP